MTGSTEWEVLKTFLCNPAVFLFMFIWVVCATVSINIHDVKPMKFAFLVTTVMFLFKLFPL